MSGGVDSSVAAALLKKQGYFVVGGYMKNFSPESWRGISASDCPWKKELGDVRKVCKKIGIGFRSFNFEKEYRQKVIDYFFAEYKAGRTPNPDVMCNKEIKFGLFLDKALELGFDYVATGHYARVQESRIKNPASPAGRQELRFELLKGTDSEKDQSYFLYTLTQKRLRHVLFPIGEYQKAEVRKIAKKIGLHNWNKKDSQGICFVGHVNLREFLKQRIPERIGDIVDEKGNILGKHSGVWYYTIGQRHGLGIGGGKAYYVMRKKTEKNQLVVGENKKNSQLYQKELLAQKPHWINPIKKFSLKCQAKIRYQQKDQECMISRKKSRLFVKFKKPQFAVAPGQAIVFYKGQRVLGGGVITK